MRAAVVAVVAAFGIAAPSTFAQTLAIVGGKVIDGIGQPPIENGVVLVEGNEIRAVGSRSEVSVPAGARVQPMRGSGNSP